MQPNLINQAAKDLTTIFSKTENLAMESAGNIFSKLIQGLNDLEVSYCESDLIAGLDQCSNCEQRMKIVKKKLKNILQTKGRG